MEEQAKYTTVAELEKFFEAQDQELSFNLSKSEKVLRLCDFYKTHIQYLKSNPGNSGYMMYYNRLVKAKEILEHKNNS